MENTNLLESTSATTGIFDDLCDTYPCWEARDDVATCMSARHLYSIAFADDVFTLSVDDVQKFSAHNLDEVLDCFDRYEGRC